MHPSNHSSHSHRVQLLEDDIIEVVEASDSAIVLWTDDSDVELHEGEPTAPQRAPSPWSVQRAPETLAPVALSSGVGPGLVAYGAVSRSRAGRPKVAWTLALFVAGAIASFGTARALSPDGARPPEQGAAKASLPPAASAPAEMPPRVSAPVVLSFTDDDAVIVPAPKPEPVVVKIKPAAHPQHVAAPAPKQDPTDSLAEAQLRASER